MNLTSEQKAAVSKWIADGDNLSAVQKKLAEQFKLSLTYMDVRFLVDDLNLALQDPAPKQDASDVTKAAAPRTPGPQGAGGDRGPEKKGLLDRAKEKLGLGKTDSGQPAEPADDDEQFCDEDFQAEDVFPPETGTGAGGVSVTVDKVTLLPNALASGTVTFSDGVTGKWVVDNYGRPGFTEISKPGYRPSQADAQAFMQELSMALQNRGF